jgi:hypothetical protein
MLGADDQSDGDVFVARCEKNRFRRGLQRSQTMMRRYHLFEIEDQTWCPRAVRDGMTDFLAFSLRTGNHYALAIPWLDRTLRACASDQITDLCSGGSGPWPTLLPALNAGRDQTVTVCLTDKYPNLDALAKEASAGEGSLKFSSASVDAMAVPGEFGGVRTIFTAFHHFTPEQGRALLRDAARQGRGVCVFEVTQRSAIAIALTLLSPLIVLLTTPLIRPFRWSRLVLTYIVPVIPAAVLFDGVVSCLRTYTPADLRYLIDDPELKHYDWHAGEERTKSPIPMTYLVGYPAPALQSPNQQIN